MNPFMIQFDQFSLIWIFFDQFYFFDLKQYEGVWNLSSDQGNLGSFIFTNVRIVWFIISFHW